MLIDDQREFEDAFERLVWPETTWAKGGCTFEHGDVTQDRKLATDYVVRHSDLRTTTLAARVQEVTEPYRTFTIRVLRLYAPAQAVEFQKMCAGTHAAYHVHAYIRCGRLLAAAAARSRDLAEVIRAGTFKCPVRVNRNEAGRPVVFVAVGWDEVPLIWHYEVEPVITSLAAA